MIPSHSSSLLSTPKSLPTLLVPTVRDCTDQACNFLGNELIRPFIRNKLVGTYIRRELDPLYEPVLRIKAFVRREVTYKLLSLLFAS